MGRRLVLLLLLLGAWAASADAGLVNYGPVTRSNLHSLPTIDVRDAPYNAQCNGQVVTGDGSISATSAAFTSSSKTFAAADVGKYISVAGAGSTSRFFSGIVATAGTGYNPQDTATDGTSTWVVGTVQVVSATVVTGGVGGTTGTQTFTGTTGAGTARFQITGTVSGGVLSGTLTVTVGGNYADLPANSAAEPVTGGGMTTAPTLSLTFGAATVYPVVPGGYANGSLPSTLTQTSSSGSGTGLTVTPTFLVNPLVTTISSVSGRTATLVATAGTTVSSAQWEYGTDDGAALNLASSAAALGGTMQLPPEAPCFTGQTITVYSGETLEGDGPYTSTLHATSALSGPLIESLNAASLWGSNSSGGVQGLVLKQFRADGNAPQAPGVTDTLEIYGYAFLLQDLYLWDGNQRNLRTEYGSTPSVANLTTMEASARRLTSYHTPGYGTDNIYWSGPHDSRWQDVLAINAGNGSQGVWFGSASGGSGGLMVFDSHVWASGTTGAPQYSWLVGHGNSNVMLANTTGEGMTVANVKTQANGLTISGGAYYKNPQTTNNLYCFEIGDAGAGYPASYTSIRTYINDCEGGIAYFNDDGGYSDIQATGAAKDAGTPLSYGTASTTTNFAFRMLNGATVPVEFHTGLFKYSNGTSGTTMPSSGVVLDSSGNNFLYLFGPSAAGTPSALVFGTPTAQLDGGIYYNSTASKARSLDFRTFGNITRFVMDENGGLDILVANAGTTGTTQNKLAKLTGAPSTAVITSTSDTDGAVGVVFNGAGTSGNAVVVVSGQASCVFDGATTAGDWVGYSTTTAGDCTDKTSTRPTHGIGRVLSTNASAGTYTITVAPF